ncbi:MAG TPA: cobalamin B12-binding domain-containing protein, partial [Nitrososphaera sp.]|nr:cobalamin B12-binding domain-containing protein [Nitrososphaera sp.]
MRIVLINVPNTYELVGNDPVIIKEQQGVYPPLGILYIAAYLQRTGRYDVHVIDAQCENLTHQEVAERVKDMDPDMVGLTAMTFTLVDVKMVIQEIRKRCNPYIVIGGPHTAIYPNECFNREGLGADFVVVGEGEITLDEMCQDIALGNVTREDSIERRT